MCFLMYHKSENSFLSNDINHNNHWMLISKCYVEGVPLSGWYVNKVKITMPRKIFLSAAANRHLLSVTIKWRTLDSDSLSRKSSLAMKKQENKVRASESKSFSAKQNITTGFLSALRWEKKACMQVFQKVLVSFSQRIAEVTKAACREQTWGAGPTPTVPTKVHANILAFVGWLLSYFFVLQQECQLDTQERSVTL